MKIALEFRKNCYETLNLMNIFLQNDINDFQKSISSPNLLQPVKKKKWMISDKKRLLVRQSLRFVNYLKSPFSENNNFRIRVWKGRLHNYFYDCDCNGRIPSFDNKLLFILYILSLFIVYNYFF